MNKKKIILLTLSPISHRTAEENLGLGYLTSILRNNDFEVEIIDAWLKEMPVEKVYEKVINKNVLFVGISSYMSNTISTIKLIKDLKNHNSEIKIVCGGFGPTFYPDQYLNNSADIVIRGEGEQVILNLANHIAKNLDISDIEGISYKDKQGSIIHNEAQSLIENLDILPFPARDTLTEIVNKKSTINVLSARGCSGNCNFCSVVAFFKLNEGKVWRSRSIKNIVDELEELSENGIKHIKMIDDSFIDGDRDAEWVKQFKKEILNRNLDLKIRGSIRADKVTDEILSNLKESGFYSFSCGIENGSEKALERMNKKATLEDNKNALELFKKYNYFVQMGFILFDSETTKAELEENYQFLSNYDWTITKGIFSEMFSAQGTTFTNKLKNDGHLLESDFLNNNNKYNLSNNEIYPIYNALKIWQKSHSILYDKVIDPLSSPKALDYDKLMDFYDIAMDLKQIDLKIFRNVLDLSYKSSNTVVKKYIGDEVNTKEEFYNQIDIKVKKLYKKNNIFYNANKNPFI